MIADWTGTSPQVKGAINNTLSFTKAACYTGDPLGAAAEHPEQRGLVPRDRGDRPAGHDRQRRAAGRLRRARPDRLPHGRQRVRRAGADAARPRRRGLRGRQHRHLDRRLRRRPHALHLRRLHLRRLGRPALGRRPRRQLQHVRQHGLALGRGHRGRAAAPDPRLRVHARQAGAGQVPRRRARSGATTASSRTEGVLQVRADRRTFRPYGLYGGEPGRALVELSEPGRREPAAAGQVHHDHAARRRLPPRAGRAPAAGATRWSATRRGAARRAQRAGLGRRGARRLRRRDRRAGWTVDAAATARLRAEMRARAAGDAAAVSGATDHGRGERRA